MKTEVHILVTCLSDSLLTNSLLVFRTLRVGFPEAEVVVWLNRLKLVHELQVRAAAGEEARFYQTDTVHDAWIEQLIMVGKKPFWISDTDVVYHAEVESFFRPPGPAVAGRLEPTFLEEWTGTVHAERLHTALMYFNPLLLRSEMSRWLKTHTPKGFPFAPETLFIRQQFIPSGRLALFYDTCAGLYQAGLGTPFTELQNAAFAHLHCGTYVNQIKRCGSLEFIDSVHRQIWGDPSKSVDLLEAQTRYYESRKP